MRRAGAWPAAAALAFMVGVVLVMLPAGSLPGGGAGRDRGGVNAGGRGVTAGGRGVNAGGRGVTAGGRGVQVGSLLACGGRLLDADPVRLLVAAPAKPEVLYSATAQQRTRMHVFASADSGTTWYDVTGSLPALPPVALVVPPGNPGTVYLGLGGRGAPHLWRSRNFGLEWESLAAEGLPDAPLAGLAIDPRAPDQLYVAIGKRVLLSVNDAASWRLLPLSLPIRERTAIAALDVDPFARRLLARLRDGRVAFAPLVEPAGAPAAGRGAPGGTAAAPRALVSGAARAPGIELRVEPQLLSPADPTASIRFRLETAGQVRLELHDGAGHVLETLAEGNWEAGSHDLSFDGSGLPGGVYRVRLAGEGAQLSRGLVVVR